MPVSPVLVQLIKLFLLLSLLAVGGGNSVVPDMQRAAVDSYHWMTSRDFLDLYALSRVAPGPGSLLATLIGQAAAGLPGAIVATLAMYGPSCLLVHVATRAWHSYRESPWRERAEYGLAPIAIGLIFASVIALIRGEHTAPAYGVTAAATLVLTLTEWHPLLVVSAGAVVGWLLRF